MCLIFSDIGSTYSKAPCKFFLFLKKCIVRNNEYPNIRFDHFNSIQISVIPDINLLKGTYS